MFIQLIPSVMNALVSGSYLNGTSIDTNDLCIFTISYFNKTYYLLSNPKKKLLRIQYGEQSSAEIKSKYVVTSEPIFKIELVVKRTVLTGTCASLDLTMDAKENVDIFEVINVPTHSNEFLNNFFKEELLVPELEVTKYLFCITVPKQLHDQIDNIGDRVESINYLHRIHFSVGHSYYKNGIIYTNNPFKVQTSIDRLLSKLPTPEMKEFKVFQKKFKDKLQKIGNLEYSLEDKQFMEEILDILTEKVKLGKNVTTTI